MDLVPVIDFEIGHMNISISKGEEQSEDSAAVDRPIVSWHTDSYPFVCVTMLSDCSNMAGGETALRKGDGGIVKVRGPQMVSYSL